MGDGWTPTAPLFSAALARILRGTPFGAVFPPRPPPPNPSVDGRTHALRALRTYLREVTFQLPDPPHGTKSFRIEHSPTQPRIHIGRPDWAQELLLPSIVFTAGEQEYLPIGLTPQTFEDSRDRYGAGTVLTCSYEYQEKVGVEVWASTKAQQRALLAGVEAALQPVEEFAGIRLVLPDFYAETARFTPLSRTNVDDDDAGRRRRRTDLVFEMNFNLVRLVRYVEVRPQATADVAPASPAGSCPPQEPGFPEVQR